MLSPTQMLYRSAISMRVVLALLTSFWAIAPSASAAYPDKPIRMIVPFAAGGPTDAVARVIAQQLAENMGQPVLVDNRGGAGGVIATEAAASAAPDGYACIKAKNASLDAARF